MPRLATTVHYGPNLLFFETLIAIFSELDLFFKRVEIELMDEGECVDLLFVGWDGGLLRGVAASENVVKAAGG